MQQQEFNAKVVKSLKDILSIFDSLGLKYDKAHDKSPHSHSKAIRKLKRIKRDLPKDKDVTPNVL